jgi:hypothetical protein
MKETLIVLSGIPIAFAYYGVTTVAVKARIRWVSRKQATVVEVAQ